MRVFFFFDTFSSTPTAASSNDQIQKFYFFPWRTWASDGLLKQFSSRKSFTALSMNCITPPPPKKKKNYISQMHCDKGSTDQEMSL